MVDANSNAYQGLVALTGNACHALRASAMPPAQAPAPVLERVVGLRSALPETLVATLASVLAGQSVRQRHANVIDPQT